MVSFIFEVEELLAALKKARWHLLREDQRRALAVIEKSIAKYDTWK